MDVSSSICLRRALIFEFVILNYSNMLHKQYLTQAITYIREIYCNKNIVGLTCKNFGIMLDEQLRYMFTNARDVMHVSGLKKKRESYFYFMVTFSGTKNKNTVCTSKYNYTFIFFI